MIDLRKTGQQARLASRGVRRKQPGHFRQFRCSPIHRDLVQAIGGCLSRRSVPDISLFDRGNYTKTLSSFSLRQTMTAF